MSGLSSPPRKRSKSKFVQTLRQLWRCARRTERPDGVWHLIPIDRRLLNTTKTTKALLAGAAFAGLLGGTAPAINASTLLPSLKTSFNAQDQSQDKKVKENSTRPWTVADPFTFLSSALLVLTFGPDKIALAPYLLRRFPYPAS